MAVGRYTYKVGQSDWKSERPCVRLRQSSGQTITSGAGNTYLTWGVTDYMVSPLWVSTDNTKITITMNGIWLIHAGFVFSNTMPTGTYVEWGVYGPSGTSALSTNTKGDSGAAWMADNISIVAYCKKGEYYRVSIKHNAGADRTTYPDSNNPANYFAATYLGGLAV